MAAWPRGPKYTVRPRVSIMSESNSANAVAVGLWMVAQTVTPPVTRFFTTAIVSLAV